MSIAPEPDPNPDALASDAPRHAGWHAVEGTRVYAEVHGSGPAILLIPGGAEDAEGWRAVAQRLDRHSVVTYDRRGTLRSGRADWPGKGSAQHADDAAALLRDLGLAPATAFGASSGAIVAVELARRHPGAVGRVLLYEPGYLRAVAEGARLQHDAVARIDRYLVAHPDDWAGAYAAFSGGLDAASDVVAPPGRAWYARREAGNAEPFLRDDMPILTAELPDTTAIAELPVEVRFARGSRSPAMFAAITSHLAGLRGDVPDLIEGAGHALYLEPDLAAGWIAANTQVARRQP